MHTNIHVVHIGGRHGIGPINVVCSYMPKFTDLTVVEAFLNEDETFLHDSQSNHVSSCRCIGACVWSDARELKFHVMKQPMASSIFSIHPNAKDYVFLGKGNFHKWVDHCTTEKTVPVKTISLDDLSPKFHAPPDALSMDIQGAEHEVMKGGDKVLQRLSCIVSEFEMLPLYQGQALLDDQMRLMRKHGYIFFDILKSGRWHWKELKGSGALMWGEALWLRDYHNLCEYFSDRMERCLQLIKLAVISHAFKRDSYAFHVVELMINSLNDELRQWLGNGYHPAEHILSVYNKNTSRSARLKV